MATANRDDASVHSTAPSHRASSSTAPDDFEVITMVDPDAASSPVSTEPILAAAGRDESDLERAVPSSPPHSRAQTPTNLATSSYGASTETAPTRYRDEDSVSFKDKHEDEGFNVVPVANKYPPSPHASDESSIDALKPPDGGLRAWLNVLGGWLVLFSSFGYTNAFGVYQAYYKMEIYATYSASAISWIGSVQLGLFFLMALVAGPLFDKGKFRFLIGFGSAIYITSIFLIPQCNKFWQTMVVQGVMSGIGVGLLFLPALSIQSHWFARKRALAIGVAVCGSSMGGVAFPIMLNKLFTNPSVGFVDGVRASGYLIAGCLVIANLIMSPHPGRQVAQKPPPPPLKQIFTPTYCCMAAGAFLLNFGLFFPNFYVQVYAEAQGMETNLAFYTISIFNAASVFGRTVPNIMADHLGPFNLQATCCACAGIVLFCMYAMTSSGAIIVFAILYGFFSGGFISLVSPVIVSISNDLSEIGLRQGIAFLIVAGAAVGGNPICGRLLSEHSSDFKAPIMFAASMVCAGAVVTAVGRFLWAKEKGTWKV
ncbi:hypothetical protein JCM5296_007132 [Sporobolomyces johnsonii]